MKKNMFMAVCLLLTMNVMQSCKKDETNKPAAAAEAATGSDAVRASTAAAPPYENLGLTCFLNNTSASVGTGTAQVVFLYHGSANAVAVTLSWPGGTTAGWIQVTNNAYSSYNLSMYGISNNGGTVTASLTDGINSASVQVKIAPRLTMAFPPSVHMVDVVDASLDKLDSGTGYPDYRFTFSWTASNPNYLMRDEKLYISIRFYANPTHDVATYNYEVPVYGNGTIFMTTRSSFGLGANEFRVRVGSGADKVIWTPLDIALPLPELYTIYFVNGRQPDFKKVLVN